MVVEVGLGNAPAGAFLLQRVISFPAQRIGRGDPRRHFSPVNFSCGLHRARSWRILQTAMPWARPRAPQHQGA